MTLCPHCKNSITRFNIEVLPGTAGTNSWKCNTYNCPHCDTSLGVQIDPIAISTKLVADITKKSK